MPLNHDDDRDFDGYGLPDDVVPAPSPQKGSEREAAAEDPPPPARPKEPQRYELPLPPAFEVQPRRGSVSCEDCFHYVPGGSLSVDHIYEVQEAALYEFATQCKEFEKSFEVSELEDIVEKAKTLDERFDGRPRIRGYCAAGQVDSEELHLIAEIKNHDGRCADFLPGRRPIVSCQGCVHRKAASDLPPSRADYGVDYGDTLTNFDPDIGSAMSGYVNALRGEYQSQDAYYKRDEQRYAQKVKSDVSDAIFNDRSPDEFTIDYCNKLGFKACAVVNRSLRCTHFKSHQQQKEEELHEKMKQGPFGGLLPALTLPQRKEEPAPTDRAGKNRRRWTELRVHNPQFGAESIAALGRQSDRIRETEPSVPLSVEQARIPCFDCVHRRNPVNIDPFQTVHFINPEVMNVRDEYRRGKAQRKLEERRICGQPGASLGDTEVPSLHLWCDLYSRRQADGRIQEYAYCFRALKAMAPNGECPGFKARGEAPAPQPQSAAKPESQPVEQESQNFVWDPAADRLQRKLLRSRARSKQSE